MPSTEDLAAAIAQMEGFNKTGSLAQRNNNPGNLRAGPSAVGKDANGLAVFATAADGWHDLYHQIDLDAKRGLTLAGFIGKYAPPSENNTAGYLSFVAGAIGADASTKLSDLAAGSSPTNPLTTSQETRRAGKPKQA